MVALMDLLGSGGLTFEEAGQCLGGAVPFFRVVFFGGGS